MIGFHNVRFPEEVSWGSSGGPVYKTQIFETFRGFEKRNIDWCQPQMRFNVAFGVKKDTQMMELLNFFNARQGRAYGFRYKNWGNYRIQSAPIATGDGFSTRLPMWKFYGFASARSYKRLRKIVPGSVSDVGLLGPGSLVEGVDFSIDYEAGEIALNEAPGYGTPVYGNLEFDEPVRFDIDNIQTIIDQYNNNSLGNLPLIGVKSGFTGGSIFAPIQDATGSDDFYDNTRLILNFDDIATPTTTFDQSELGLPVTIAGTGLINSTSFRHGQGSFSTGATGYAEVTGIPMGVSGLPFTLEVFAQQSQAGAASQPLLSKWEASGTNRCYTIRYIRATRQLQFAVSLDGGSSETIILNFPWTTAVPNKFDYITVDRLPSGWFVLRINGKPMQTVRNTGTIHDANVPFNVGSLASPLAGEGPYQGLIDSVRVTIGRNRNPAFDIVDIPTPYPV
jgi:uncharacterized protein (TIGR02217 family)